MTNKRRLDDLNTVCKRPRVDGNKANPMDTADETLSGSNFVLSSAAFVPRSQNNISRILFESMSSFFRQKVPSQNDETTYYCTTCQSGYTTNSSPFKCHFCDKVVCGDCTLTCTTCSHQFCSFCARPNYSQRDITAYCLSCRR